MDTLRAVWWLLRAAWLLVFGRGGGTRGPKADHTRHEA